MNVTVSTKLDIPRLGDELVVRPKLVRLLSRGLESRLTLVSAPAGYGKTTSVAMWLHILDELSAEGTMDNLTGGIRVAWYALDPDDDDFSTFFTRFATALRDTAPGALQMVATGLAIKDIPPATYANTLAEACLALPAPLIVVLDDYHLITRPEIHTVLSQLIQYASARLHIVLVTRHDPPLGIARLRGRQQVTEIRANDLRLSESETEELLVMKLRQRLPPDLVSELYMRTEGWAVGVQLAALAIQDYAAPELLIESLHRNESSYVMDFLFDEVLENEPPAVKEFLLKTALLVRFNAALAAEVTGFELQRCQRILSDLRFANLFVVALDREWEWIRYHRQFQAMLVDRLHALFAPDEINAIRAKAAEWLACHDHVDDALAEYSAHGRWAAAVELIETDRHHLMNCEEWHLLWRRISQLPEAIVAQHPGLLLGQCWILQTHDRVSAIPALVAQVETLLNAQSDSFGTAQVALWQCEVRALQGSWLFQNSPPEERAGSMRAALAQFHPRHHAWVRGFVVIQVGFSLLAQGHFNAAYQLIGSEIAATGPGCGPYLTRLQHAMAQIQYLGGDLHELHQAGVRYVQLATQNAMMTSVAWARYAVGWSHHQRCEPVRAWEELSPIIDQPYAAHTACVMLIVDALLPISVELGRGQQVVALIDQLHRFSVERHNLGGADEFQAHAAYAAALQGERRVALNWADQFLQTWPTQALEQRRAPIGSAAMLICGKIVLTVGSTTQIERMIDPLNHFLELQRQRYITVQIVQGSVLLACCYWRVNNPARAMRAMQEAVELGMPRGFRRVFFEQGASMANILYAMVQRGVAAEGAAILLAEYAAWSAQPRTAVDSAAIAHDMITPLTEREMEILELIAQRLSNKEIARKLNISPITVRNHATNIYGKLQTTSRKQAIARAQALGLLPAQ